MVGLVLEGGAMRGMYTTGVLDQMIEHEIELDQVIGVSAGALFGVNFLSGQKGRAIRYNKRYNQDKDYLGLRPLLREGNIVSTEYAYERVPYKLDPFDDEAFKKAKAPFYAVVTNIETGKPEYIEIKSVFEQMDVLRASGSMPFVSKPVKIDGQTYLDGGITDSIPFEWLLHHGCDKIVVILTRDITYRKKPMSKAATNFYRFSYPNIVKPLRARHAMYNLSVEKLLQLEKEGKAYIIRPSEPITIGRIETDSEKLQAVYDLGVRDITAQMDGLRDFIDK